MDLKRSKTNLLLENKKMTTIETHRDVELLVLRHTRGVCPTKDLGYVKIMCMVQ